MSTPPGSDPFHPRGPLGARGAGRRPGTGPRFRRSDVVSIGIVLLLGIVPVLVPLLVIRGGAPVTAQPQRSTGPPPGSPAPQPTSPPTTAPTSLLPTTPLPSALPTTTPPHPVPSTEGSSAAGPGPDLVVVSLLLSPAAPEHGDHVVFRAVVGNIGGRPTPATTHGVSFLVDGVAVSFAQRSSAPLPPGAKRTYVADTGPTGQNYWIATPGGHEFSARIDDRDLIPERNESNNVLTITRAVAH
ncbi:MAG TPA: CARDB domain-containing protein [Mycobacteriales bacterium]